LRVFHSPDTRRRNPESAEGAKFHYRGPKTDAISSR
jgi:hypothetical protein